MGAFISQDPIGVNPYKYAPNLWSWIDPLGLSCKKEYVYQLKKDGKVVYYGIIDDPVRRVKEHAKVKDFDEMEILTDAVSHDKARNLEAGLIRRRIDTAGVDTSQAVENQLSDAGLLNKNRGRTPERWKEGGKDAKPDYGSQKSASDRTRYDPQGNEL